MSDYEVFKPWRHASASDAACIPIVHESPEDREPRELAPGWEVADRLALPGIGERPTFRASELSGLTVPEREWHVPGLMPCRNVTLLMANGGDGRSTIGVQLSVSTVMGRRWFGRLCRAGPVLYLSAEDDRDELHRRLEAVVHAEDIHFADLAMLEIMELAGKEAVPASG